MSESEPDEDEVQDQVQHTTLDPVRVVEPEQVSHDDVLSAAESSMLHDLLPLPADVQPGTGIPPPGPLPPALAHLSTVPVPEDFSTDSSGLTFPSDQGEDEHRGMYSDVEVSRHLGTELDSDAEVNRILGSKTYDSDADGRNQGPEPGSQSRPDVLPANHPKADQGDGQKHEEEYQPNGSTSRDAGESDQRTLQESQST